VSSEAVQALKDEIWRRAREKADKILEEAEKEAEKMLEEARRKVEEDLKRRIEPERIVLKRRILGKAIMDGRRMVILARNELIEKAFEKALEKLKTLPQSNPKEYEEFLAKSLRKAVELLSESGEKELTVYANERDLKTLEEMAKTFSSRPIKFRFEKADLLGGVVVADPDGRKVFNNSLEGRLSSLKPLLRERVASILFKEVKTR